MIFLMWDPIASLKSAKVVDAAKAIEKEPLGLIGRRSNYSNLTRPKKTLQMVVKSKGKPPLFQGKSRLVKNYLAGFRIGDFFFCFRTSEDSDKNWRGKLARFEGEKALIGN